MADIGLNSNGAAFSSFAAEVRHHLLALFQLRSASYFRTFPKCRTAAQHRRTSYSRSAGLSSTLALKGLSQKTVRRRFFELGPGGQNESVDHELAVGPIEHDHVSVETGEQGEVVGERLWVDRIGGHLRAKRGNWVCRRRALLLRRDGNRSAQQRGREELRQEGAARECDGRGASRGAKRASERGWNAWSFHPFPWCWFAAAFEEETIPQRWPELTAGIELVEFSIGIQRERYDLVVGSIHTAARPSGRQAWRGERESTRPQRPRL